MDIKKYKKEIIYHLEKELVETIKQLLVTEVHHRTMLSAFIAKPKDDNLNSKSTELKQQVQLLESKIFNLTKVMEEAENDQVVFNG